MSDLLPTLADGAISAVGGLPAQFVSSVFGLLGQRQEYEQQRKLMALQNKYLQGNMDYQSRLNRDYQQFIWDNSYRENISRRMAGYNPAFENGAVGGQLSSSGLSGTSPSPAAANNPFSGIQQTSPTLGAQFELMAQQADATAAQAQESRSHAAYYDSLKGDQDWRNSPLVRGAVLRGMNARTALDVSNSKLSDADKDVAIQKLSNLKSEKNLTDEQVNSLWVQMQKMYSEISQIDAQTRLALSQIMLNSREAEYLSSLKDSTELQTAITRYLNNRGYSDKMIQSLDIQNAAAIIQKNIAAWELQFKGDPDFARKFNYVLEGVGAFSDVVSSVGSAFGGYGSFMTGSTKRALQGPYGRWYDSMTMLNNRRTFDLSERAADRAIYNYYQRKYSR